SALIKKAKDTKIKTYELYPLGTLLEFASENFESSQKPDGRKPVYSRVEVRDLSELMAKHIIDLEQGDIGRRYLPTIERYAPGRAAQVRAKFTLDPSTSRMPISVRGNPVVGSAGAPPPDIAEPAIANANGFPQPDPKHEAEEKLMADVAKIGTGELPREERDRIVAQAGKILMQNSGKDKQITGLRMLASQVAKAGDKELAAQIMRDAESLVNPQPKNY